jgi:hypothetical protein
VSPKRPEMTIRPWSGWAVSINGRIDPDLTFEGPRSAAREARSYARYGCNVKVIRVEIRAVHKRGER